jgi:hypothetical protein
LVEPGASTSLLIAFGLKLGSVMMITIGPAYVGLGLCLGIAVGTAGDAKVKQEGRLLQK